MYKKIINEKLKEIFVMGYIENICVDRKNDDGNIGQTIERKLGIEENNKSQPDFLDYNVELKTSRNKTKSKITLFTKVPDIGMKTRKIFEKYGYTSKSKRYPTINKKKLNTTITYGKYNNRGFTLKTKNDNIFIYKKDGDNEVEICGWSNLENQKINNTLLVFADTKGKTNSKDELFHYTSAVWLENPISIVEAIKQGLIVIEFAIEEVDGKFHDRGVKFRISKTNLYKMFKNIEYIT
jgi:hypothetical protein